MCPACFIFEENLAVALCQRCLSLSGHTHTHKQRDAHPHFMRDAWRGAISALPSGGFCSVLSLSESVFVCVCLRDQMEVRPVVSVPCQHRRPPLFAASLCPVQSPLSGFLGQEVCRHGNTLLRTALWSRSSLREDSVRSLCHCLRLFSPHTFTLPPSTPLPTVTFS